MNKKLIAITALLTLAVPAVAQRAAGQAQEGKQPGLRRQMIERFDTNEDGTLEKTERQALRKFVQKRRSKPGAQKGKCEKCGQRVKGTERAKRARGKNRQSRSMRSRHQAKGQSSRSQAENTRPSTVRKRVKARFDRNKDGKLSRRERRSLRRAIQRRRGQRRAKGTSV